MSVSGIRYSLPIIVLLKSFFPDRRHVCTCWHDFGLSLSRTRELSPSINAVNGECCFRSRHVEYVEVHGPLVLWKRVGPLANTVAVGSVGEVDSSRTDCCFESGERIEETSRSAKGAGSKGKEELELIAHNVRASVAHAG